MDRIRRMPERARTDRAELDAVLDAGLVGTLSTVADGLPWVVPMLYARDGDRILLHGSTGAGALRQVADGADAALCVTHLDGIVVADNLFNSSANYRSAVVRGCLETLNFGSAATALTALSERLIPGRSSEVARHSGKELAATLTLALTIVDGGWTVKVRDAPPSPPNVDPDAWAGVVPMRTVFGEPEPAPWVPDGSALPTSVRNLLSRSDSDRNG